MAKLLLVLVLLVVSVVISLLLEAKMHRQRLVEIAAAKPKKRRKRFVPDYTI